MSLDKLSLLDKARNCLNLEIEAIKNTAGQLDERFAQAIEAIQTAIEAKKKLIFSGVGKNAHICQKLVGTFNSTGVPACFLDPSQALHGDLGLCSKNDLAFLFSNSGQTDELIALLPLLKRLELKTVAVTGNPGSELAANSDLALTYHAAQEACPLNLVPTATTTAALALGDALAMVYLEVRGFTREDFAQFHPAGSLGKSLLLRVSEIMRSGERFASLPETVTVQAAIMAITKAKCGAVALTHPEDGSLTGVFTDGDFRRGSLRHENYLDNPVREHMTPGPKTVSLHALAVDALKVFEKTSVNDLIVVDENQRPVGLIDGQDLPHLRIV